MKRRGFLGFLGGAAAAGPALTNQAANTVLRQAGFAAGSDVVSAAPAAPMVASSGVIGRFVQFIRKNGIPSWKMAEIVQRANYERQYGLDPDPACLRSVSPGFKARRQRRRNIDRLVEASLSAAGRNQERSDFMTGIEKTIGGYVDWYE